MGPNSEVLECSHGFQPPFPSAESYLWTPGMCPGGFPWLPMD